MAAGEGKFCALFGCHDIGLNVDTFCTRRALMAGHERRRGIISVKWERVLESDGDMACESRALH